MGMAVASAGPYANNLHTNTSSVYTGRMLFLTPNQQCQSTEGITNYFISNNTIIVNVNVCVNVSLVPRLPAGHCPYLLLNAVLRRSCCWAPAPPLPIDISCPRGRSATNPPHAAAAVDRWDRRTDGQTLDRFMDPDPHTMRAVSIACTFLGRSGTVVSAPDCGVRGRRFESRRGQLCLS